MIDARLGPELARLAEPATHPMSREFPQAGLGFPPAPIRSSTSGRAAFRPEPEPSR
jgi:hypothetical protein